MSEEETTDPNDIVMRLEEITDPDTKKRIQDMSKENLTMTGKIDELTTIITKMNTDKEIEKFDKQRSTLFAELTELHPSLAKQHKDTKDLGTLKTAIATAKSLLNGFQEFKDEKDKNPEAVKKEYQAPRKY